MRVPSIWCAGGHVSRAKRVTTAMGNDHRQGTAKITVSLASDTGRETDALAVKETLAALLADRRAYAVRSGTRRTNGVWQACVRNLPSTSVV